MGNRGIDPELQACVMIRSLGWRDGVTRAVEFFGPIYTCVLRPMITQYASTAGPPGLTTMLWRDKDVDESRRRLNPALSLPLLIWCRWTISIVWLTPSKRLVHVHVEKQNKVKRGVVLKRPPRDGNKRNGEMVHDIGA